jgi:hypothetical protein
MNPGTTSNGLVKVDFICLNCKEGKHGCARHWTGLGLEIRCTCYCATINEVKSKK